MARGKSTKRDKIILLLEQGETNAATIAKKVGCGRNYVFVLKREFLRSKKVTCG